MKKKKRKRGGKGRWRGYISGTYYLHFLYHSLHDGKREKKEGARRKKEGGGGEEGRGGKKVDQHSSPVIYLCCYSEK